MEIISSSWKMDAPIRMITVTAMGLVSEDGSADADVEVRAIAGVAGEQMSLFDLESGFGSGGSSESDEKSDRLDAAMDVIRERFGRDVVGFGRKWSSRSTKAR